MPTDPTPRATTAANPRDAGTPASPNELRQDPLTGRWVTIATGRAARPGSFARPTPAVRGALGCPFCEGNEHLTPPEVEADRDPSEPPNSGGWTVRVVPNKFAAFGPPGGSADPVDGRLLAAGGHEVIIHGATHRTTLTGLAPAILPAVLAAWRRRLAAWRREPMGAVTIIVNEGPEAGASLEHSHSQLFATALRPQLIEAEMERLRADGCAACELVERERKTGERVVGEGDGLLTVCPWASAMPFESLILPDAHSPRFEDGDEAADQAVAQAVRSQLDRLRRAVGNEPPLNLVLHSAPPGVEDFHWHLHVLPRLTTMGGFELGTGVQINVVDPDSAAERLRAAGAG